MRERKRFMKVHLLKKVLIGCLSFLLFVSPLSLQAENESSDVFSVGFVQEYVIPGDRLEVEVSGCDSYELTWTFDGLLQSNLKNQTSYIIQESDLQKLIKVTAISSNGDRITIQKLVSKLPVVYIDIENGEEITTKEPYRNAVIKIQSNETYKDFGEQYEGKTQIKGRGNSTWNQPKKPYRLKFDKKANVFGMGKNKHWVLLANYLDTSLLRNKIAYDLSGAMGSTYISSVHVDLVINGSKRGNYQLGEHIRVDDDRVPVFDWEGFGEDVAAEIVEAENLDEDTLGDMEEYLVENMGYITSGYFTFNGKTYVLDDYGIEVPEITGGYAIELDEYYDEVSKFKTSLNQPLMFKGPEFVNTNRDMMNYISGYINAFEAAIQNKGTFSASYDGNMVHYSDLFDMDALIDYWMVQELFFNEDAMKKSSYLYKEIGEKVKMGPIWDMDWSSHGMGDTSYYNRWQTLHFSLKAQNTQWYKYIVKDPYYLALAQVRYQEIRPLIEDIIKDGGIIDQQQVYLAESGAANDKIWPRGNFNKDSEKFQLWMNNRVTWLDSQFANKETLMNSISGISADGIEVEIKHTDGSPLLDDVYHDGKVAYGKSITCTLNSNDDVMVLVNGKALDVLKARETISLKHDQIITMQDDTNVITFARLNDDDTFDVSRSLSMTLINDEKPLVVENLMASNIDYKSMELSWDAVKNADHYTVERFASNDKWIELTTTKQLSHYFSGLKTGKTYIYRVKAKIGDEMVYSDPIQVKTTLNGKLNLTLTKYGSQQFELKWNKVMGATRYIIYRKSSLSDWKKILTLDGDSRTYVSKSMEADTYTYLVKAARYDGSERVYSDDSNEVVGNIESNMDHGNIVKIDDDHIRISWIKISGYHNYIVYRSNAENGHFRILKQTACTNITTEIKNNTYCYRIRGYRIVDGEKILSNEVITLKYLQ